MFRLNRMADYAVVILGRMAAAPGDIANAADLAGHTSLPGPMVARVLKLLARAGVITSYRGAVGGYALERRAEDVTVAEILTALSGPVALTACVEGAEDHCAVQGTCHLRGRWDYLNGVIRSALESVTLADMIGAQHPLFPPPSVAVSLPRQHGVADHTATGGTGG